MHTIVNYVQIIYIYIYIFKLLILDWIIGVRHEPLMNFFKFFRSHSSLNAKFHTLNDIRIFFFKYHWEANIIFYKFFFTTSRNSHGIYRFRGILSRKWVKNKVFIAKFGQKVLPTFMESPLFIYFIFTIRT